MTRQQPHIPRADDGEFREVLARLREVGESALADGQAACCYALTKDSVLLRALARILNMAK